MRLCTVEGCSQPYAARGMCRAHYQRWYTHGTPDGGQPIATHTTIRCPVCRQPVRDRRVTPYHVDGTGVTMCPASGRQLTTPDVECGATHEGLR